LPQVIEENGVGKGLNPNMASDFRVNSPGINPQHKGQIYEKGIKMVSATFK
jgi:hypothetical protein